MNLEIVAQKFANDYLNKNLDMNESIAKYASEHSLGIEQTKRLVEEANKNCYLQKFASTGEQTFDVAQFDKVKELVKLTDHIEKKASLEFVSVNYDQNFEKTASEENKEPDSFEYQKAIDRCHEAIGKEMTKLASCKDEKEIELSNKTIEKYEKIAEKLLEKKAGLVSGLAGAALKTGATVGGKTIGFVAEAPMKRGLMPLGYAQTFKSGFNKNMKESEKFIEHTKTAGVITEASKSLVNFMEKNPVTGSALALGAIGLSIGAAKGMGGIASRMMEDRKLNESFNTLIQANSDLKQIPNARAYFDVVARHSPSLAMDPMVAPQLIRQFDTFGGVDVNTVGKLREIEATGRKDRPRGGMTATDFVGGVKNMRDLQFSKKQS